ncbi:vomeronasal type-1 receptor 4-like [Peromyscus californicus insignis]|uniref:vomeronasal type-1 receptor 4-like n=1 Tax=Peromyscus californicus insignis TaxID=564181 RepID=UPI0022A7FE50|nr:vomeronasal type-1 receptor 4-like [Peromyscus californicus insignis]
MDLRNFTIRIMFLIQSTVGILGNLALLLNYIIIYHNEHTLKPTDLILTHLITANFLIILSKGVPNTMAAFGMKQFFNDFICKLFLYIQRLGRSMSMGTTCLLSVYQAITISPNKSFWKNFKFKSPNYISLCISIYWVMHSAINFIFPVLVHIKRSHKNATEKRDFAYCSSWGRDKIVESLYTTLLVFPEVLFSVLIIWSSGSMITILYRHKQHIQHIRSTQDSLRTSPEARATQSILVLVSSYIAFYTLSSILQGFIAVLSKPSLWLMNITAIISMCFPTLCPFLMNCNFTVLRFCLFSIGNIKNPVIVS